jgi:hypothetical protein
MQEGAHMLEDGATLQGSVTTVQRIGDTIRRPVRRWTPAMHALLRHLEAVGFSGAPRVLGYDDQGREILSLLPGEVARRPWPPVLHERRGIIALAGLLHDYHDAVSSFVPAPDAEWYVPDVAWNPGQIVRHGDLGPWNSVWQGDRLIGLIDWDFAEPGMPLEDVAQLAWYLVPLRGEDHWREAGFTRRPDLRTRLETLCEAYGASPIAVLDALNTLQTTEIERTRTLAERGIEPWASFAARGEVTKITAEKAWLTTIWEELL